MAVKEPFFAAFPECFLPSFYAQVLNALQGFEKPVKEY